MEFLSLLSPRSLEVLGEGKLFPSKHLTDSVIVVEVFLVTDDTLPAGSDMVNMPATPAYDLSKLRYLLHLVGDNDVGWKTVSGELEVNASASLFGSDHYSELEPVECLDLALHMAVGYEILIESARVLKIKDEFSGAVSLPFQHVEDVLGLLFSGYY